MPRVPYQELHCQLQRVLLHSGFTEERAALVARLFADNQRDGIYSHGLNRFPRFIASVRSRQVDIHATPSMVASLGALEQWDGKMGVGLWNAHVCMSRAIELARQFGMGGVGLRNTNHWMRGGAYGLQATDAGCIGICWTNTIPLLPPWGSAESKIGNNPLVIAVPRAAGPLLLDMALSQYSNGKLEVMRQQGRQLPIPGGYDERGNLTRDPAAILASRRALPIGHWKGSALAVALDAVAALLSGGRSSHEIGKQGGEYGVSQVFIAINASALAERNDAENIVNAIVNDLHTASSILDGEGVRYPGEGMLRIRQQSFESGVFVEEEQWNSLREM